MGSETVACGITLVYDIWRSGEKYMRSIRQQKGGQLHEQ